MKKLFSLLLLALVMLFYSGLALAQELVVYTSRGEKLIKPLLDEFSKETGIPVKLHTAGAIEILNRLRAEGSATPADVFISVDAATIEMARQFGLLEPMKSDVIIKNIPKQMRAQDNSWAGLTYRLRVIVYNPDRVRPNEIRSFDDLRKPTFKGRLGLRTGSNIYVQSQVAMMLAERNEREVEAFLRDLLKNAGNNIYPSDYRIVEAVARGEIDVGIVNHYYVHLFKKENPNEAQKVDYIIPQKTAYNATAVGIVKFSKNKDKALKLVEFLASDKAQKMVMDLNFEYPANPNIQLREDLKKNISLSDVSLYQMGRNLSRAIDIIDRVGYR